MHNWLNLLLLLKCHMCKLNFVIFRASLFNFDDYLMKILRKFPKNQQNYCKLIRNFFPYSCNWVGPDSSYCGKRFSASDDLFQHLRAEHTGNAIPDALLNASSASTNSLLAAFPRTYPTPPLSPLSSARYHPYSKNPLLPPPPGASSLAGLLPPHPSLAQYFSPYAALYPRMSSSNLQP